MLYTINTRAVRHGFLFSASELEPLGISEGTKCWGLWSEGRGLDENARLDGPNRVLQNESPHLVVSPIYPDWWPISFHLHAYLERRHLEDFNADNSDGFAGFTDAVSRCGANILYIQTAQVGYDVLSVIATCDFPALRPIARAILKPVDEAGAKVEACRLEFRNLEKRTIELRRAFDEDRTSEARNRLDAANDGVTQAARALNDAANDAYAQRVRGFQTIGRIMIPKLAMFETQLSLIDAERYRHWKAGQPGDSDRSEESPRDIEERSLAGMGALDPFRFRALVGDPSHRIPVESQRTTAYRNSLFKGWFLNRKVVGAGENLYFLGYSSIARPRAEVFPTSPDLRKLLNLQDELDTDEIEKCFAFQSEEVVQTRVLPSSLESLADPTSPTFDPPRPPHLQPRVLSGGAERATAVAAAGDKLDMTAEAIAHADLAYRQSLLPVRVSALPSLAYARFWALGGAYLRGAPIELTFRDGLLTPSTGWGHAHGKLGPVFDTLNDLTRSPSPTEPELGEFAPQCAVIVNANLSERMLRLRFVREAVEANAYQTYWFAFEITHTNAGAGTTRQPGLLATISAHLLTLNLRVERARTSLIHADQKMEAGELELVARAIDEPGRRRCVEALDNKARSAQRDAIVGSLNAAGAERGTWVIRSCSITPGFVPNRR